MAQLGLHHLMSHESEFMVTQLKRRLYFCMARKEKHAAKYHFSRHCSADDSLIDSAGLPQNQHHHRRPDLELISLPSWRSSSIIENENFEIHYCVILWWSPLRLLRSVLWRLQTIDFLMPSSIYFWSLDLSPGCSRFDWSICLPSAVVSGALSGMLPSIGCSGSFIDVRGYWSKFRQWRCI